MTEEERRMGRPRKYAEDVSDGGAPRVTVRVEPEILDWMKRHEDGPSGWARKTINREARYEMEHGPREDSHPTGRTSPAPQPKEDDMPTKKAPVKAAPKAATKAVGKTKGGTAKTATKAPIKKATKK